MFKFSRILVVFSVLFLTCHQPFTFKSLLDHHNDPPLYIYPAEVNLYIGSSITFYVSGGQSPYTYSILQGSGTISQDGIYDAPAVAGEEIILVEDDHYTTIMATVTVTDQQLETDYYIQSITQNSIEAKTGTVINESFVIANQGSSAGTLNIFWNTYVSADNNLDAGDSLVSSGQIPPLDSGAQSSSIPIAGTWPDSSGFFYLIVELNSIDDNDSSNDIGVIGTFAISASDSDIDYIISNISQDYPIVSAGTLCSETFSLTNLGGLNGSELISWSAYASLDQIIDGADILIVSNPLSLSGLNSGESLSDINITGAWPMTSGTYYLLLEISANDETVTNNNLGSRGPFQVLPPPDYTIENVQYKTTGETETQFSLLNEYSFEINEISGNAGGHPINWKVYRSLDAVLDGTDPLIASDVIPSLRANESSGTIPFNNLQWPSFGAYYSIILQIDSGDDSNSLNNQYVTPSTIAVPEIFSENPLDDNSDVGPTTVSLTNVSEIIMDGASLDVGQLVHINGTMDVSGAYDTYQIMTGNISTLEVFITWSTGDDALNFYLWDMNNNEESSLDDRPDSEPLVPTPPAKIPVNSDSVYYIGVEFLGNHSGSDYQVILHGK